MKKVKLSLFVIASMMSLTTIAQTIDEVIGKHVEALGGTEKLASLKSVRMEATMSVQGMELPMVTTRVAGVGQRVDLSVMGQDGYMIVTPTAGWIYFPFMGQTAPEAMPAEQLKTSVDQVDLQGPLVGYKEKGNKVELLGKETIDGAEAFKIKLTTAANTERTYFIDSKTFYILRTVEKGVVMGQEQEIVANYSNYKKTDEGYVFAYSISSIFGQGDLTVNKIEVNKPIDEKIFKAN